MNETTNLRVKEFVRQLRDLCRPHAPLIKRAVLWILVVQVLALV